MAKGFGYQGLELNIAGKSETLESIGERSWGSDLDFAEAYCNNKCSADSSYDWSTGKYESEIWNKFHIQARSVEDNAEVDRARAVDHVARSTGNLDVQVCANKCMIKMAYDSAQGVGYHGLELNMPGKSET